MTQADTKAGLLPTPEGVSATATTAVIEPTCLFPNYTNTRQEMVTTRRQSSRRRRPVATRVRIFQATIVNPISGEATDQVCVINFTDFLLALGVKDIPAAKNMLRGSVPDLTNGISVLQWDSAGHDSQRSRGARLSERGDGVTLRCALQVLSLFEQFPAESQAAAARELEQTLQAAVGGN